MSEFLTDYSLKPYNTFGLDVKAKSFAKFKSLDTLKEGLQLAKNQPLLILGGGSNLLFTKDYDGLVLKNELKGIDVIQEDAEHFYVEAQAGENWHQFVMHCIANNWAGVENLSLIPGTVGAAPMQNIGAYGVEIIQVFDHLKAMEIATGEIHTFNKEDCQFGYRESVFKKSLKGKYVITSVCFKLKKDTGF